MSMRLVDLAEYDILEGMVIELSRYHGGDSGPDAQGLRDLLWGDRAVGTAVFYMGDSAPLAYAIVSEGGRFQDGARTLEVVHLGVAAAARGQGIGAKLMADLEDYARQQGCDRIKLTAGSERAQDFYDKIGYEKSEQVGYRKVL